MTHVDDLYEPADDREPEPCDWYPAPEPVDLEEVEGLYRAYVTCGGVGGVRLSAAIRLADLSADLVAELREARRRIAEFEALEKREDWTVTPSRDDVPTSNDPLKSMFSRGDLAEETARRNGWQLWRQRSLARPWEPIDSDPPF